MSCRGRCFLDPIVMTLSIFNDKIVLIAITNYGVKGVVDNTFYSHYSLLKTVEEAFDLPFIGHAKDAGTNTLAPLLVPADD